MVLTSCRLIDHQNIRVHRYHGSKGHPELVCPAQIVWMCISKLREVESLKQSFNITLDNFLLKTQVLHSKRYFFLDSSAGYLMDRVLKDITNLANQFSLLVSIDIFPEPLTPMIPTISPFLTRVLTWSKALVPSAYTKDTSLNSIAISSVAPKFAGCLSSLSSISMTLLSIILSIVSFRHSAL